MVRNNLRKSGPVIFSPTHRGEAIRKALVMSPAEVIRAIKTARLRGRGGAGFPCGMKWEFTRAASGSRKFVVCNADEGEPGTFKDRVVLTEIPDRVFAGMTIAGYAIGASEGILYLRAEYAYLRRFLEDVLAQRRADNLLGRVIAGKAGFDFDIRIQMGAGAYVCGEETALLSSCEGLRGDPKTRPPFPAEKGYLGCPTSVNNVETLCGVTKIMEGGPATFASYGSPGCTGTKLLSVCGDCRQPGVYEVPMGTKLSEVLHLAGAENAAAVQVGGPSGQMVGPAEFHRTISYDDLGTGGSVMVFGPRRDLLEVVRNFVAFFAEESCGYCTPCRVGNVLLLRGVDRVIAGRGEPADLAEFERIARTMKSASRCGLGQTSSNPVTSTLKNFRSAWESRLRTPEHGDRVAFDLSAATACARGLRNAAAAGGEGVQS
ncbi:MAG: iron hydrogenase [Planctomycetes bacterium]|nr:iron hydrogenase [Planctomycetota bacterium]